MGIGVSPCWQGGQAITRYTQLGDDPRPFVWTRIADEILESVAAFGCSTKDSRHQESVEHLFGRNEASIADVEVAEAGAPAPIAAPPPAGDPLGFRDDPASDFD